MHISGSNVVPHTTSTHCNGCTCKTAEVNGCTCKTAEEDRRTCKTAEDSSAVYCAVCGTGLLVDVVVVQGLGGGWKSHSTRSADAVSQQSGTTATFGAWRIYRCASMHSGEMDFISLRWKVQYVTNCQHSRRLVYELKVSLTTPYLLAFERFVHRIRHSNNAKSLNRSRPCNLMWLWRLGSWSSRSIKSLPMVFLGSKFCGQISL